MSEQITFLGCKVRKDQYKLLENIASQFGKNISDFFGPKGNKYISVNPEGLITYILISNFAIQKTKEKRRFEVPEQLSGIEVFKYDSDANLGELVIPDTCRKLKEVSCVHDGLFNLKFPKDLSNLRVLKCFCNELKELHLETAVGLQDLEFQHNQVSKLYLPQSTPRLSVVRYHNNPLPEEEIAKIKDLGF